MSDIADAVRSTQAAVERPLVVVDNTFLGPVFQHPLTLGADLAVYSATKYLSGFSDMLGGVALGKDPELIVQLRGTRAILGNILQPDECWMLDGRLPTVELRMTRQSKNAQRIAEALAGHPKIERFYYPTLFTDPEQCPGRSSPSTCAAARPRPSTSCGACGSRATRLAWGASSR
jgi:methionine-gamma-lyase